MYFIFYNFCLGSVSVQLVLLETAVEIHVGLHMMCLLSDFNRSRNVSVNFSKTLQYKILLTTSQAIMCGQIYRLGEANISFFVSVSQLGEFFSHNLLLLINRGLLFRMLSVIHHCIMADLKKQCICIKFCFKLLKTASRTQETKSGFTVNGPETKR